MIPALIRQSFGASPDQRIPFGVTPAGHPILQSCCYLSLFNECGGVKVINLIDGKDGALSGSIALPTWINTHLHFEAASGTDPGVDYGTGPQTADLALGAFSIVARVRPGTGWGNSGGVARRNDGNTVNAGWEVILTNAGMLLCIERATANFSAKTTATISTSGKWTTVALVYFGDLTAANVGLYYDGVAQAHTGDNNGSGAQGSDAAQKLVVGSSNFNNNSLNSGRLLGWMDWCGIWRRVLRPEEILLLTNDPAVLIRTTSFNFGNEPGNFPALTVAA